MAETAIPADSASRAVQDDIFTAVTGYTLNHQFAENYEIYLSKIKKAFLADFAWGMVDPTQINQRALRYWAPSPQGATSSGARYQLSGGNMYFAGTHVIKDFGASYNTVANSNFGEAQKRLADASKLENLIPGETYRFYYAPNNGTEIKYFEYKAISAAIMGQNAGSSAHDLPLVQGLSLDPGATAFVSSIFTLGLNIDPATNVSNVYTNNSATAKYGFTDETGFNGYFILGGDIIVEDAITGSKSLTPGYTIASLKSFQTHAVPAVAAAIPHKTVGALKHANYWTDNLDLEAIAQTNVGFNGIFDGRGHTIDTSFARGGIFGVINGGTVKNLNIKADFYQYDTDGDQLYYTKNSYSEKSAVLAEAILDGSTIENVAIELTTPAPTTFNVRGWNADTTEITDRPEMDDVKAIVAADGVYGANTSLKNVIVRCDTLQYVGNSIQNYRSALNVDSSVKNIDNLFVIGSSYTNMTIDNDYTLTISVPSLPEGVEEGQVVALKDNAALLAKYGDMIYDMYKWLRNENIVDADTGLTKAKIKFVLEPATKKFATEADFQAYLNGDGAADKAELIATGLWKEKDGSLIWAEEVIEGTTYEVIPQAKGFLMPEPLVPTFEDYYGWSANFGEGLTYNVRVTLADGTAKSFSLA